MKKRGLLSACLVTLLGGASLLAQSSPPVSSSKFLPSNASPANYSPIVVFREPGFPAADSAAPEPTTKTSNSLFTDSPLTDRFVGHVPARAINKRNGQPRRGRRELTMRELDRLVKIEKGEIA